MWLYRIEWLIFVWSLSLVIYMAESIRDWTPEFLAQTRKANCILGNIERDVTFLHGTDSGNFKKLGKVADMDVCALLCCEMQKCEAAFMADRNCFAVECHSPAHCATAPAHKNKFHPLVVFMKRLKKSENNKSTGSTRKQGDKSKDVTLKEGDKSKDVTLKEGDKSTGTTSNEANKPNIQPSQSTNDGMKFAVLASDSSGLGKGMNQAKAEPITQVKHAKIPQKPSLVNNVVSGGLAIPSKTKIQTLQMDETPKHSATPVERHKSWREKKMKQSRDSLVSAAVVTCSMAFLLSFAAMVAAKIRKHKESTKNPDYSSVPTGEDHD